MIREGWQLQRKFTRSRSRA